MAQYNATFDTEQFTDAVEYDMLENARNLDERFKDYLRRYGTKNYFKSLSNFTMREQYQLSMYNSLKVLYNARQNLESVYPGYFQAANLEYLYEITMDFVNSVRDPYYNQRSTLLLLIAMYILRSPDVREEGPLNIERSRKKYDETVRYIIPLLRSSNVRDTDILRYTDYIKLRVEELEKIQA